MTQQTTNRYDSCEFMAGIDAIRSTADGGWKIVFECGSDENEAVKKLIDMQGKYLQVAVVFINKTELDAT